MPNRETRTLSFTQEHTAFVTRCVESGRYQSASEVVRAALRLLQDHESQREAEFARIRELVQEGLADIDRGDVVDGEEFMRTLIEDRPPPTGPAAGSA